MELQLAWMIERWGPGVLGPQPDFKLLARCAKALDVYGAFKKDQKDRTGEDWKIIKDTLKIVEEWQA